MTTYGTFEIDSVPAPSPFDPVHLPTRIVTFNRFCTSHCITYDRPIFSQFTKQRCPITWTWTDLEKVYAEWSAWGRAAIIAAEDARDLRETQQDALI